MAHAVGKAGNRLGARLTNGVAARITAEAVNAIAGGTFWSVIARLPLVQFGGARIGVTPSTVAGITLPIIGAFRIARGGCTITGEKLAVDWSWGGAVAPCTEGFILLVAAGAKGIGADCIVLVILARSGSITLPGTAAGTDAFWGAIVVGVLVH